MGVKSQIAVFALILASCSCEGQTARQPEGQAARRPDGQTARRPDGQTDEQIKRSRESRHVAKKRA